MAQPRSKPGAMPLSSESSRSKQDVKPHSKRGETRQDTRVTESSRRSLTEQQSLDSSYHEARSGDTSSIPEHSVDEITRNSIDAPHSNSNVESAQYGMSTLARPLQSSQVYARTNGSAKEAIYTQQIVKGATVYTVTDTTSGMKTVVATGPPAQITALDLQQQGIFAHRSIVESKRAGKGTGSEDKTTPDYKIKASTKNSFKFGNVIELRYAQPRQNGTDLTRRAHDVGLSRRRRFVVIREGREHSMILPISTYGGLGVTAQGIVKAHHSIIYTGAHIPSLLSGERSSRTEGGVDSLLSKAIQVEPHESTKKLDGLSRLNYATIYQISHTNCEIYSFGAVADQSRRHLFYQFNAVQDGLSIPFQITHWNGMSGAQPQTNQQIGQAGPSHARVDSVQQRNAPQEVLKESDEEDTQRDEHLVRQMAGLNMRARNAGIDLALLSNEQRDSLARMSVAEQTQYILYILQRQNPQRYAQLQAQSRQRGAAESQEAQGSQDDNDEDDDDDDDDEDESEEEDESSDE